MNDVKQGSDGLRIWGFEKSSWVLDLDGASWFWELAAARLVGVNGMPAPWLSQWVESWRCTNRQHSKKLCVSLLMSENLKLKKLNKSFVPEPISCFRIPICVWTLWTFYAYEYLGRIFGPIYYTSCNAMMGTRVEVYVFRKQTQKTHLAKAKSVNMKKNIYYTKYL